MTSRLVAAMVAVSATLSLGTATGASASLVADYRFEGDLESSVAGAPAMFPANASGPAGSATINGCQRSTRLFEDGAGFGLSTGEITDPRSYTVIVQARLDDTSGYKRILNWYPNFANDNGLYLLDGALNFYDSNDPEAVDHLGSTVVPQGAFAEYAVTRSAAGQVVGYTNGIPQFSHLDSFDAAVTPHPAGNVYFFVDNNGEDSAGAIARVRVYDSPLPARQITNTEGCFNRRCAGRVVTIAGDRRPNVLIGTPGPDVIAGLGGRDTIKGLGGRDRLCGEGGADRLDGGRGRDLILGGPGRDRLFGGPGRDRCLGGPGRDRGRRCERGSV